ncbi:MAG: HU family DNA-binding protein [Prevotella sp.]|jgi:nucleoid DNA-binding protein
MNKIVNKDLARVLADKFGLDRASAEKFVGLMFDVVIDGLKYDKLAKVKGLGTFKVTSVAPRKSVDVNTGEPIIIEGRDKINFTADTSLRDRVNRPFAQFETVAVNEGVNFDDIDRKYTESMDEEEEFDEREEETDAADETVQASAAPVVHDDVETTEKVEDNRAEEVAEKAGENETQKPLATPSDRSALPNEEDKKSAGIGSEKPTDAASSDTKSEREKERVVVEEDGQEAEMTNKSDTVLSLSAAQLAALNGRNVSAETSSAEAADEQTSVTGEAATGQPQAVTGVKPDEVVRSAETSHANDASGTTDKELETIKSHTLELEERVEHQHRYMKILMGVCAVLLLTCLGGIVYMTSQLQKRNHRIEHLEAAIVSVKYPETTESEAEAASIGAADNQVQKDSAKMKAQSATTDKKSEAGNLETQQKAEQKQLAAEKQATNEAKRKAEEKKATEVKQTAKNKQTAAEKAEAARQAKYNSDVRVRTGAYVIVGIDHTETVRAGQTLTSISKANLGPGMECYVEAVNDGRTEFKAGEKIKIPKLKLKKK